MVEENKNTDEPQEGEKWANDEMAEKVILNEAVLDFY